MTKKKVWSRYILLYLFGIVLLTASPIFSLPVGLEVRIFTDPSELSGPHDSYSFTDSIGTFELSYYIEVANLGDESAQPCSLLIALPENCIESYEPMPEIPLPFTLVEHRNNTYLFIADAVPPGTNMQFSIGITLDIACLPIAVEPPNCATVQADAFLNSPQEHESYTDNTTFCRIVADTTYADLYIEKSVVFSDCTNDSIVYRIVYGNNGAVDVENAVIRDVFPEYAMFAGANPPPTGILTSQLLWQISSIPAGFTSSIDLALSTDGSPRPCEFVNSVVISSDSTETSILNNTASASVFCADTADSCYDLVSSATVSENIAYPDSFITIQATVRNMGLLVAHNVELIVEVTPPVVIVGQNRWSFPLDSLAPGAETTFPINITLTSGCQPIERLTVATMALPVDDDCNPDDNSSVVNLRYKCPTICPPAKASTRMLTPNGDGINDIVRFSPSENVKVCIYNERGILMRTLGDNVSWDGRDENGRDVEPGVYIWQMFCPGSNTEPHYTGTIAVKR